MFINISEQTARKILFILIIFEICLVVAFYANRLFGQQSLIFHKMFNLDGENNIPALFSSLQLLVVGVVFGSMLFQSKRQCFSSQLFPAVIAIAFIFLSLDEAFLIHESIISYTQNIEWMPRFKGDKGIWIAPYIIVGIMVSILFLKNIKEAWCNCRRESGIIGIGIGVFITGGVVLEIISYQFLRDGSFPWYLYRLEVALEEFMEMIGISIVLYGAILMHQKDRMQSSG